MTTAPKFSRTCSETLIQELQETDLYRDFLERDISAKPSADRVFPALRRDCIDFYYGGGRVFSFLKQKQNHEFVTHLKYASVLDPSKNRDYVSQSDLAKGRLPLIRTFGTRANYRRVKENCGLYAGTEGKQVGEIASRSSCAGRAPREDVVVLDIEIAFGPDSALRRDEPKTNRVDLLLYNTVTKRLRFYEAKDFSNPDLWAKPNRVPRVLEQLKRYNTLLADRTWQNRILQVYRNYVNLLNRYFIKAPSACLAPPECVEPSAVLLVFGYDRSQKGRLDDVLQDGGQFQGQRVRCRGSVSGKGIAGLLWKAVKEIR